MAVVPLRVGTLHFEAVTVDLPPELLVFLVVSHLVAGRRQDLKGAALLPPVAFYVLPAFHVLLYLCLHNGRPYLQQPRLPLVVGPPLPVSFLVVHRAERRVAAGLGRQVGEKGQVLYVFRLCVRAPVRLGVYQPVLQVGRHRAAPR